MATEVELSYSEIYEIVTGLGAQQAVMDRLSQKVYQSCPNGGFDLDTRMSVLAGKMISNFVKNSIDDLWSARDSDALRRAYEYGYNCEIDRSLPR